MLKKVSSSIANRFKFYGKNTKVHGLYFVADDERYTIIRIFWLAAFVVSSLGMAQVIFGAYKAYRDNPISFVTETAYLEWNTTFPAVSICEISNQGVFWTVSAASQFSPIQQFVTDIVFFTGSCYSCSSECPECEELNFRKIVKQFRKSCDSLMGQCEWNDIEFPCCEQFLPLETEYGVCFSINSMHTEQKPDRLNMESNRETGPGELYIETFDDLRLYFHPPEDVPFINSESAHREDVALGEQLNIIFNVIEIENDPYVEALPVSSRKCRFPWEKPDEIKVHSKYSYSSCVVQCHADAHKQFCNCTHHLMPVVGAETYCDIEGLLCLTDYYETVNRLHADGFENKPGLSCDCVPSCDEPEYKVVLKRKLLSRDSRISIKMDQLPTQRFKRNVVRTALDLVVSIGGSAGLFLGASLLSILEVVYLLLRGS